MVVCKGLYLVCDLDNNYGLTVDTSRMHNNTLFVC